MCIHNGERFLPRAVDSILGQTFRDFELILVNDGSTDESAAILNRYASIDDRVRVFHQSRTGLTRALNFGLSQARGKYIARQDADDESTPDRLQRLAESIGTSPIVVSTWMNFGEGFERMSLFSKLASGPLRWTLRPLCRLFNPFAHGTYFFARETALEIGGYDESFRMAQDYDFLLRITRRGPLKIVSKPLYRLRIHTGSLSSTKAVEQCLYSLLAALRCHDSRAYDALDVFSMTTEDKVTNLLRKQLVFGALVILAHSVRYGRRLTPTFGISLLTSAARY